MVPLTAGNTIRNMRDAAFTERRPILPNLVASQPTFYADGSSNEPLGINSRIESLGQTQDRALIVTVPVGTRSWEELEDDNADEEVPAKRQKLSAPTRWESKEEEPIYSVVTDRMFFVGRDSATQQLLQIHKSNYHRAKTGCGMTWLVPLVDHISGLGKSMFDMEYIRSCNRHWNGLSNVEKEKNGFLNFVRKCHTIRIQFHSWDLLDDNLAFDSRKAASRLIGKIALFISTEYDVVPRAVDTNLIGADPNFDAVLVNLTMEVGPLFFVIDDIGMAFNAKLSDGDKIKRFMDFGSEILMSLLSVQTLFFLIAGRVPFLSCHLNSHERFVIRLLSLGSSPTPSDTGKQFIKHVNHRLSRSTTTGSCSSIQNNARPLLKEVDVKACLHNGTIGEKNCPAAQFAE